MACRNCFTRGLLLLLPSLLGAQTQNFNVGQWFFGKNVTAELPAGVIDLADNLWASDTYTCPLVMTGVKQAPTVQLMCRSHNAAGARFEPVITEGDTRLAGTRLAIPTTANNESSRYLTSMVRPERQHLYFTSVTGSNLQNFSNKIAWRLRDYRSLERVAGVGDVLTVKLKTGVTQTVTLTAAGPIDADESGREFIYLESNSTSGIGTTATGLYEIKAGGVFEAMFHGTMNMRDTPWGMGGFVFDDGGLVFRQAITIYQLDPNTKGLTFLAQEGSAGQPFMPASVPYANMDLAQFFRPTDDLTTAFFNWGSLQGQDSPNEFFSILKDWTQAPLYRNALGSSLATTASSLASGDRVTVMGAGPNGPGSSDYDAGSRITLKWPFTSLWLNRDNNFIKVLRDTELPDSNFQAPKKYYQGITSYRCQVEFATKRYDTSFDNSGPFNGFYRLARPCLDSATFNTATRELVIRGLNLQDLRTEVGTPSPAPIPAGAPLGQILPARLTTVTPTEIRGTVDSVTTLERILVLVNGAVWSDPVAVRVTTEPAPILADFVDMNFDHTFASPHKLMTVQGAFNCQTAQTPSVNYPTSLGNCAVLLDNSIRLPLLYTDHRQINFLLPSDLTAFSHNVRVTRTDANGVFNSEAFIFTSAPHSPIAIKNGGNVIVVVIRNGQVVVLGPSDPIRPGEYFTVYLTGALLPNLPATARLGDQEIPYAAAAVSWAQGVVQVNIQAPAVSGGFTVKIGDVAGFPVTIR